MFEAHFEPSSLWEGVWWSLSLYDLPLPCSLHLSFCQECQCYQSMSTWFSLLLCYLPLLLPPTHASHHCCITLPYLILKLYLFHLSLVCGRVLSQVCNGGDANANTKASTWKETTITCSMKTYFILLQLCFVSSLISLHFKMPTGRVVVVDVYINKWKSP